MTLSKTVLYWLNDYYCSWCTSHNPPLKWIILFALPNVSLLINFLINRSWSFFNARNDPNFIQLRIGVSVNNTHPDVLLICFSLRVWLVIPTLIVFVLGKDLVEALQKASGKSKDM
jgi:hypothetical protein